MVTPAHRRACYRRLELLNANEQLQADNGALVLVNEAIGERREIRF